MDISVLSAGIARHRAAASECKDWMKDKFSRLHPDELTDQLFINTHMKLTYFGVSATDAAKHIEYVVIKALGLEPTGRGDDGDALIPATKECVEVKTTCNYSGDGTYRIKRIRQYEEVSRYILWFFDGVSATCEWYLVPAEWLYRCATHFELFKSSPTGTKKTNVNNINIEDQMDIGKSWQSREFMRQMQVFRKDLPAMYRTLHNTPRHTGEAPLLPVPPHVDLMALFQV